MCVDMTLHNCRRQTQISSDALIIQALINAQMMSIVP